MEVIGIALNQPTLSKAPRKERAVLVGVAFNGADDLRESLSELAALADTAELEVVGMVTQVRREADPAYFVGRGKAEEVARLCGELNADIVIVDHELTPAQARNLENLVGVRVVDRTELILDIFARRARTKQAMLQVELAQLQYQLPRLRRMWQHLSRLGGGIGTRGPGETQLEIDQRRAKKRIADLQRQLREIQRQTSARVQSRKERQLFTVALVGYTNVGKSTLMNALTKAQVFVEDRLFATLDATTRVLVLPDGHRALLTDTIGFIRKLPPHLIASFHATLEEVRTADLLLHVADVTHPALDDHIAVVERTLQEIGAGGKPTILVLNKADRLPPDWDRERLSQRYPNALLVSALTGNGLDELRRRIQREYAKQRLVRVRGQLALWAQDLVAFAYRNGVVYSVAYTDDAIVLDAEMERHFAEHLQKQVTLLNAGSVSVTPVVAESNAHQPFHFAHLLVSLRDQR
ncbi:GTPase HflX [bacterium HR17]|uniref:GTPase HflX n=1 Tax=Candidatus Fervidibacter japonicus TaxID=2035412 RepID=A0A2H5XCK8_9BACT|nr:GTPase HflX [bacterium HR17]